MGVERYLGGLNGFCGREKKVKPRSCPPFARNRIAKGRAPQKQKQSQNQPGVVKGDPPAKDSPGWRSPCRTPLTNVLTNVPAQLLLPLPRCYPKRVYRPHHKRNAEEARTVFPLGQCGIWNFGRNRLVYFAPLDNRLGSEGHEDPSSQKANPHCHWKRLINDVGCAWKRPWFCLAIDNVSGRVQS